MENDFAEYLDRQRPTNRPPVDRVRFTPTEEVNEFLMECKAKRLDI